MKDEKPRKPIDHIMDATPFKEGTGPRHVLLELAHHRNSHSGLAWPAQTTIAQRLGYGRDYVNRCYRQLIESGDIKVVQKRGNRPLKVSFPAADRCGSQTTPHQRQPGGVTGAGVVPKPIGIGSQTNTGVVPRPHDLKEKKDPRGKRTAPASLASPPGRKRKANPTLEEVLSYNWGLDPPVADPKKFWLHFQAKGWAGVSDWQARLLAWQHEDQQKAAVAPPAALPAGPVFLPREKVLALSWWRLGPDNVFFPLMKLPGSRCPGKSLHLQERHLYIRDDRRLVELQLSETSCHLVLLAAVADRYRFSLLALGG